MGRAGRPGARRARTRLGPPGRRRRGVHAARPGRRRGAGVRRAGRRGCTTRPRPARTRRRSRATRPRRRGRSRRSTPTRPARRLRGQAHRLQGRRAAARRLAARPRARCRTPGSSLVGFGGVPRRARAARRARSRRATSRGAADGPARRTARELPWLARVPRRPRPRRARGATSRAARGLADRVAWAGRLDHDELADLLPGRRGDGGPEHLPGGVRDGRRRGRGLRRAARRRPPLRARRGGRGRSARAVPAGRAAVARLRRRAGGRRGARRRADGLARGAGRRARRDARGDRRGHPRAVLLGRRRAHRHRRGRGRAGRRSRRPDQRCRARPPHPLRSAACPEEGASGSLPLSVAVAALVGASGCELDDDGDNLVAGKQAFVEKCGSCHVLKRAGTTGVTGPEPRRGLPAGAQGRLRGVDLRGASSTARSSIPARNGRRRTPRTGKLLPPMPADLVKGETARGRGRLRRHGGRQAAARTPGASRDVGVKRSTAVAKERERHARHPRRSRRRAGLQVRLRRGPAPAQLDLESKNDSQVDHNIAVEGGGLDEKGPVVKGGGVSGSPSRLRPGTTRSTAPSPATARAAWSASSPSSSAALRRSVARSWSPRRPHGRRTSARRA